jgi:hypothetical protein
MNFNLDLLIENEYHNIYNRYWKFMKNDYIYHVDLKYHRSKITNIPHIDKVKENIYNKIGSIPTFVFLTDLCNHIKLPGPYVTMDKALILLEHLLNGKSINEMEMYIPSTSFYKLYQSLYINNYEILENWINEKMEKCFSSHTLRLLCAKKFNPSLLDNVTVLIDGHHNRITYQDINLDKKELFSYKLKRNGLNTQFIIDINKMCIYISDSLPCRNNNDDKMLLDININKFYNEVDCICFDGLYENTVKEFIEKFSNIGFNICLKNFCYPIKKDKGIELTIDERKFNEELGGFRSKIEKYFAELGSIFIRFNGQTKVRITDNKTYNIQLKLAVVLLNIKYFTDLFGIDENIHYSKWKDNNSDYYYPQNKELNTEISLKTKYKIDHIIDIKSLQTQFINNLSIGNIVDTNDNMEEDIVVDKNENNYEVQYIIKHRKSKDSFEYYIKWKNYSKDKNTWVKESDFIYKDIIINYWKSINSK